MSGSEQYSDATIIKGATNSTIRADTNDSNVRIRAAPTNNAEMKKSVRDNIDEKLASDNRDVKSASDNRDE
ncbi:27596_t:CDS:2 [Dentiscutata erythropus]|uniref:27596_t:CDS:1 n=1 Tax=Dentiscutata erythropus TaxID=1348616 RepID=A0A9N9HC78_9GLOM|nr:27596_t:CDS:2 [Dentiscutata erythropus]